MTFEQWTKKFRSGRKFSLSQFGLSENEFFRRANFAKNIEMIKAHNAKYARGEESFKMGVNQFSDMSFEEFKTNILGGFKAIEEYGDRTYHYNKVSANADSVDWRTKGAVTAVKNQGQCRLEDKRCRYCCQESRPVRQLLGFLNNRCPRRGCGCGNRQLDLIGRESAS